MNLALYDIVYILINVFGTYIIFKFMGVFFDRKEINKKRELLSYALYYIVITSIYIVGKVPIIMMISNLIGFIILSFNYKASLKKRLLSSFFIYLILMSVEMSIVLILGYTQFTFLGESEYSSYYSLVIIHILSYFIVLVMNNYKNIKYQSTLSTSYWLVVIMIPISSLVIILTLFQGKTIPVSWVILSIVLLLCVNFAAFHLYDVLAKMLTDQLQQKLMEQQNKYYDKQFDMMKTSLKMTSTLKHDLRNHLATLQILAYQGQVDRIKKHLDQMNASIGGPTHYAYSGNMIIDSILNFKIQEAKQKHIETSLELSVPEQLDVTSFDMAIILGNLIDNAMNAVEKIKEPKTIEIKIKYDKGRLIMCIQNPFNGILNEEDGKLRTTHVNKEEHGLGLESVKQALERYHGTMAIDTIDNIFKIHLIMFI